MIRVLSPQNGQRRWSNMNTKHAYYERKKRVVQFREKVRNRETNIPDGMYTKCTQCQSIVHENDVREQQYVCPRCGYYFRMYAVDRILMLADADTFAEIDATMAVQDPLAFPNYPEKLEGLRESTGLNDAVITGTCEIEGVKTALAAMDSHFLMGSMGSVVGEKLTRLIEKATKEKLPLIIISTSGGARMQEGIFSLMQMAKVSMALKRYEMIEQPYISVLTDPTTGGVMASFAMLGDYIFAEPRALLGFAGKRVIENTIGQKVPDNLQRAETLLKNGFLDGIIKRNEMKKTLATLVKMHEVK